MSDPRRVVVLGLGVAAIVAIVLGVLASPGHALARATGGAALTLLLVTLVTSPIARLVSPRWAVAARAARRTLGITSACVAIGHASLGAFAYLVPLDLRPLLSLPWLRHGALALAILLPLLLTSFPALQRMLRVRAWSALHRLVYAAAIFASLHALAVPFGSAYVGVVAVVVTGAALLARPLVAAIRRRPAPDPD